MLGCWKSGDEPPHQILLYTLLFSLFHYFLYITDPPLCTAHQCDHTWLHLLTHDTHTHFIRLALLIWWTYVLWFTCFISILSSPNMCPPMARLIMNPHTAWSGTYYSFTLDEPYACFLGFHLYLTCLYLPFDNKELPIWVFLQHSDLVLTAGVKTVSMLQGLGLYCL